MPKGIYYNNPMLLPRVLTALVGIPLLLYLVHAGGAAFSIFVAGISALCCYEYALVLRLGGRPVQFLPAVLFGGALAACAALGGPLGLVVTAGVEDWAAQAPADMVDERPVAALHRATRSILEPQSALAILAEAGSRTGDYIVANRIPVWARAILKVLPAALSSRALARAITAHAWTFVGSGRFVCKPGKDPTFEIWSNPLCAGETSAAPMCVWHAAVFERLYQALVSPRAKAVETHCSARGDACCRFAVSGIRR